MMKRYAICLFSMLIATTACDKDKAPEEPAQTSETAPQPAPSGLDGELTKAKAQAFAEAWFKAYNARDWESLESYFANDAEIVLQRDSITDRVSPAVWKSQHSRAEKQAAVTMKPEIVEFGTFDGGAFMRMNVTSRYEDRVLPEKTWEFLIREVAGERKVAIVFRREERSPAESAPDRAEGTLVVADGMVLQAQPTTEAERGYRTLLNKDGLTELWVEKSKLPVAWQQLDGQNVELFDRDGKRCESDVVGYRYYGRLDLPEWVEASLAPKVDGKLTARDAGELTWKMAGRNGRVLVARLDPAGYETCETPIWARVNDGDAYPTYPQVSPEKRRAVALQKFGETTSVARIEKEYDRLGDETPWYLVGQKPDVHFFSDGKRTFATVSATSGSSCDDFVAGSFAIWEVKRDNWTLLTPDDHKQGAFVPYFVADVNNDGSPEFYGEGVVVRERDGSFQIVEDVRPVSFEGGC